MRSVDDLPGFHAHPPGSPPAPTDGPAVTRTPVGEGVPDDRPDDGGDDGLDDGPDDGPADRVPGGRRRRTAGVVAGAAVVVVAAVVTAVVVADRGDDTASTAGPAGSVASTDPTGVLPRTTPPASSTPGTTAPAPITAAAAGDLADTDLPPGDGGFTAAVSFVGVVLEPRAVGVTVAYPALQVSSDGISAVAHLDLAVWNCLSAEAPADPVAAQCTRSLAEFADLGTPELEITRSGDRVDLTGAFATYTRPNGSAPAYTGRRYDLTVQLTPAGTGATGTLTLGGTSVGTTGPGSFSG